MGSEFSHLNISNIAEIIECDSQKLVEVYETFMETRGEVPVSLEDEVSLGDRAVDIDIAYSAPQNFISRVDCNVRLEEFDEIFIGFHESGAINITTVFFVFQNTHNNSMSASQILLYLKTFSFEWTRLVWARFHSRN